MMDAVELTTLVNTIANLFAVNLNAKELALTAAIFTQLGDTLATIAIVRSEDNEKSNIEDDF